MSRIRTSIVTDAHAYTHSKTPWLLDAHTEVVGKTATGRKFGWKLIHYLSGGGLRTFGRTVEQEERAHRQTRFLVFAGCLAALWLVVLIWG